MVLMEEEYKKELVALVFTVAAIFAEISGGALSSMVWSSVD